MKPTPLHRPAGRRRWRWLALMLALMLLAPAAFLYLFVSTQKQESIEYFLPDRLAAAVRLSDLETVWDEHWRGRPGTSPDAALKDLYIAWDKWDRMVEKHGEVGAYAKVKLMPAAIFGAFGEESWLLAGEWGGGNAGEGEAGLVLLIPGKSSLNTSAQSIAELLLDDYTIQTTSTLGVRLHEYRSTTDRKSLTVLRTGGWVVISNRRFGLGPLPVIVERVKNRTPPPSAVADFQMLQQVSQNDSRIWATIKPEPFWDYLDLLNRQRGRSPSDEMQASVAAWRDRLAGTDRVTIVRDGESLLDLTLAAEHSVAVAMGAPAASTSITALVPRETIAPAGGGRWVALAEGNAALLHEMQNLIQLSDETLENLNDPKLDLFLPGLRAYAATLLASTDARVGTAIYPSSVPILPRILAWHDRAPLVTPAASPDAYWAEVANSGGSRELDTARWFGPATPHADSPEPAWPGHVAHNYSAGAPPAGFAALDFGALARLLENVPTAFMDKKELKKFNKRRALARAMAFGLGGATLRLDETGELTTMRLRTLHAENSNAH